MSVKLNDKSFHFAKTLVEEGRFVPDERDMWSEHKPTAEKEDEFIEKHGFGEYEKWHLGTDDEHRENTKGRYKFPYGDFKKAHRCGVISAESRAGQYKYFDIEKAAMQLKEMMDKSMVK
jgi:hypothetical protein